MKAKEKPELALIPDSIFAYLNTAPRRFEMFVKYATASHGNCMFASKTLTEEVTQVFRIDQFV
jgi:hypothetical protein